MRLHKIIKFYVSSFVNGAPFFSIPQLSPNETLAGIAIKYNVSVEDLKRANGLVNDWDLWMRTGWNKIYFIH